MEEQNFKRHLAHKMKIGDLHTGKIILDGEKFKFLEYQDKNIARVNIVATVIEKYVQDDEKKFGSVTIDDSTGQIKLKTFGDDLEKISQISQGEVVLVVGLLRSWKNELYITPEIIRKKEPKYLLARKLELDLDRPKEIEKSELSQIKNQILTLVRNNEEKGGINIDEIIMSLKTTTPAVINSEIKRLLEEGVVYEPRPGKLRYLG